MVIFHFGTKFKHFEASSTDELFVSPHGTSPDIPSKGRNTGVLLCFGPTASKLPGTQDNSPFLDSFRCKNNRQVKLAKHRSNETCLEIFKSSFYLATNMHVRLKYKSVISQKTSHDNPKPRTDVFSKLAHISKPPIGIVPNRPCSR